MKSNLLHRNLDKSCYMTFSHKKSSNFKEALTVIDMNDNATNRNEIVIGTTVIHHVDEAKFLDVTSDQNLSRDAHTKSLYKQLKCATSLTKHIKPGIPKNFKTRYLNHIFCTVYLSGDEYSSIRPARYLGYRKSACGYFLETTQLLENNTCVGAQFLRSEFYINMHEHTMTDIQF